MLMSYGTCVTCEIVILSFIYLGLFTSFPLNCFTALLSVLVSLTSQFSVTTVGRLYQ